ncbi:hypothetical protein PIB30_044395 [Stylosanthes scabra]|uniref:Uncharacterized protein n=1 Tax=Stylosanthes scabra TaxID=79078 RepID=A0ABU6XDJ2_9FABA|nr:hypothetical protein [Stylosanthes scabra]
MRRSNQLRAGKASLPSPTRRKQVEVIHIEDDSTDYTSDTTPTPLAGQNLNAKPNPFASPPGVHQFRQPIITRTSKGNIFISARIFQLKRIMPTSPESDSDSDEQSKNDAVQQPLLEAVPPQETVPEVQNHNSVPSEVESQSAGGNVPQPSTSLNRRKRRAFYKRPAPSGQATVRRRKGEAPKVFVPTVHPDATSGEDSDDGDSDPEYAQSESDELQSPYSSGADSDAEVGSRNDGRNVSQPSSRQRRRNTRASYKRPPPTGQPSELQSPYSSDAESDVEVYP